MPSLTNHDDLIYQNATIPTTLASGSHWWSNLVQLTKESSLWPTLEIKNHTNKHLDVKITHLVTNENYPASLELSVKFTLMHIKHQHSQLRKACCTHIMCETCTTYFTFKGDFRTSRSKKSIIKSEVRTLTPFLDQQGVFQSRCTCTTKGKTR